MDGLIADSFMEAPGYFQRFSSVENLSNILTQAEDYSFLNAAKPIISPQVGADEGPIYCVSAGMSLAELDAETIDSVESDEEVDVQAPMVSTPLFTPAGRRRPRVMSTNSSAKFEFLDDARPWESECVAALNTVPEGFEIPVPSDHSLSLGDLRVIGRFHVQKVANQSGTRLPAGMTNSDLIELADNLGLYPLMYRLHLEAVGKVPLSPVHALYLEYKKESKLRAKRTKAEKDLSLAGKTRLRENGSLTIDYFEGIALRLGRERDTIFRPLLHRVFREFKSNVKQTLKEAGLNYNEMRKWRDTQLCTALFVANQFYDGIWQAAVDVHLSKTAGE